MFQDHTSQPLNQNSIILHVPAILALGKGAIRLEQEQEDTIQEFLNGVTIGNLAYHAYVSRANISDIDVTLMVTKRLNDHKTSLFLNHGAIVGFLSSLIRKGNLTITSHSFSQGYQSGLETYCRFQNKLFTLSELCALISYKKGDSAYNAGYIYNFLKGLIQATHVVKPRIPGEGM